MLTPAARLGAAICLVAAGACAATLARPARYEVEGLSMAPGLMPGDIVSSAWFPAMAGGRHPRRHERWILTAPDGTSAIKRVVGQPGERVSIRDGDLTVGGQVVVSPPTILAETASAVPEPATTEAGDPGVRRCGRAATPAIVLDDASFAPTERRLLLPVRDVGLAATIRWHGRSPGAERLRARVGASVIAWRPPSTGRFAVVAGRLDGHLVAVCWRCDGTVPTPAGSRSCLPPGMPSDWQLAQPWPSHAPIGVEPEDGDTSAPWLAVWIEGDGTANGGCDPSCAEIEQFCVWRDVLHRPAADGREEWRLGPHEFLVLGDYPSGSLDSRQWGPLHRSQLHTPVSAAR